MKSRNQRSTHATPLHDTPTVSIRTAPPSDQDKIPPASLDFVKNLESRDDDHRLDGEPAKNSTSATRTQIAENDMIPKPQVSPTRVVVESEVPASSEPPFLWYIDELSSTKVTGWIYDPEKPSQHFVVALREEGQVIQRTAASHFRADLAAAGLGDGCCSFELRIPDRMEGGARTIEVVEEQTDFVLTAHEIESTAAERRFGHRPEPSTRSAFTFRAADGRRGEIRGAPFLYDDSGTSEYVKPQNSVRSSAVAGTRIMFDISDLIYYIGNHPNLTGIQRVQSGIVLSMLEKNLSPRSNLIFLSFNHRTKNLISIPIGFFHSLLRDLFLPETQRVVSFSAEEARYGLLPGDRSSRAPAYSTMATRRFFVCSELPGSTRTIYIECFI